MSVSNKRGYSIETDMKGLDALYKRLQDLNQKEIQYGYFEDARYDGSDERAGLPVAVLAWWHENGLGSNLLGPPVQANYPARPFFTQSIKKAEWMVKQTAPTIFKLSFIGKLEKSFVDMAKWLKESVQDSIDEQNFIPLAPYTVDKKGNSTILVETGQLRDKVEAKIVNSNAYGKRKKEVDIK